jgi:hypothetical protein
MFFYDGSLLEGVMYFVLATFGDASGLRTNLAKSEAFPIRCTEEQILAALQTFPAKRGEFPCTYLGLPLHHSRLKAIHFQPLIDKLGARLAGWWGKHFTRAGRVLLCRSVLSAMVIYHLPVFKLPKWIIRRIEKIKRGFLWMKPGAAPGSRPHSLVNWSTVCRPKELGGLGIFDIEKFGRALRLRWPWYAWADQARPWQGMTLPCDATDMELFMASTDITIGDGAKCLFWLDRWMPGGAPKLQYPELFAIASRKSRTVLKELQDRNWLRSLFRLSTATELANWSSFGQPFGRWCCSHVRMRSLGVGPYRESTLRLRLIAVSSPGPVLRSRRPRCGTRMRSQISFCLAGAPREDLDGKQSGNSGVAT